MYVLPVKKHTKPTNVLVGRDDKRKKFHVVVVAKGVEAELPPAHLRGKITEMGFDVQLGIKAEIITKVYAEIQALINNGYTEEEAPPVI